jgi:hypothetical protein
MHRGVDHRGQRETVDVPGQVHDRAGRTPQADAVTAPDDLVVREQPGAVRPHPRLAARLAVGWRDDVHQPVARRAAQPPEPAGGRSTDHELRTARAQRGASGELVRFDARERVATVDEAVQHAGGDEPLALIETDAGSFQLGARDRRVVTTQPGDRCRFQASHGPLPSRAEGGPMTAEVGVLHGTPGVSPFGVDGRR